MKYVLRGVAAFLLVALPLFTPPKPAKAAAGQNVVINQVRLGGPDLLYGSVKVKEYVTLFNQGDKPVSLKGWVLEYAKSPTASIRANFCGSHAWQNFSGKGVIVGTVKLDSMLTLAPGEVSVPIMRQLNDTGPGALRLVDASPAGKYMVHDLIGWGAGAPCKEAAAVPALPVGAGLTRYLDCEDLPIDTGSNVADFSVLTSPEPGSLGNTYKKDCYVPPPRSGTTPAPTPKPSVPTIPIVKPGTTPAPVTPAKPVKPTPTPAKPTLPGIPDPTPPPVPLYPEVPPKTPPKVPAKPQTPKPTPPAPESPVLSCAELRITELLVNPEGVDASQEFIELHNPTLRPVLMSGCALQVGTKQFALPKEYVAAGQYRIFSDTQTNLTLPNELGGSVSLIAGTPRQTVTYPQDPAIDEAWALIGTKWLATDQPTPAAVNKARTVAPKPSPRPPAFTPKPKPTPTLAPCPAGKFRNPATNRCKGIVLPGAPQASLTPCAPGKYRNPLTNRCKSFTSTAQTKGLLACTAGQERNPVTNRCRKVQAAQTELKACKAGQERNPHTNRCRKVAAAKQERKPCKEGQERNPETNRCRKVAQTASLQAGAPGMGAGKTGGKSSYMIVIIVLIAAVGYAIYEYKDDIKRWINDRRSGGLLAKQPKAENIGLLRTRS